MDHLEAPEIKYLWYYVKKKEKKNYNSNIRKLLIISSHLLHYLFQHPTAQEDTIWAVHHQEQHIMQVYPLVFQYHNIQDHLNQVYALHLLLLLPENKIEEILIDFKFWEKKKNYNYGIALFITMNRNFKTNIYPIRKWIVIFTKTFSKFFKPLKLKNFHVTVNERIYWKNFEFTHFTGCCACLHDSINYSKLFFLNIIHQLFTSCC